MLNFVKRPSQPVFVGHCFQTHSGSREQSLFLIFLSFAFPCFGNKSLGTLDQNRCRCSYLFPGQFFNFFRGLNPDCLGFKTKHLVWDGLQKPTFHRSWNSNDFKVHFWCFWVAMGSLFMTFDDFWWPRWEEKPRCEEVWVTAVIRTHVIRTWFEKISFRITWRKGKPSQKIQFEADLSNFRSQITFFTCFGGLGTTLYDFGCDCWGLGGIWVRRPRAYSRRIRTFSRRIREYRCRISEMSFN